MPLDPQQLPDDPRILRDIVVDLSAQLEKTHRLLRQLIEAKTGRKSEKLTTDQLSLFAAQLKEQGVELGPSNADPGANDNSDEGGEGGSDQGTGGVGGGADPATGGRRGRKPLAPHLKRERVEHDLDESQKHCPQCDQDLRPIGEECSERYKFIPAQLVVAQDVCRKYACDCTIHTATKPPQPIEKSNADASLLSHVITSKFADHLPVNRQGKIFRRFGVEITNQTIGGWLSQSADLLGPLYDCLKRHVLSSKVIGTDDTGIQVLDRSLDKTRTGRIWPYVGDGDHPGVVFDYTPTRERAGPEKFLESYRGKYLQADAYSVYDVFFKFDPNHPDKTVLLECGCMAHARRHFRDALPTDGARMGCVLAMIGELYQIEEFCREKGLRGEQRKLVRQARSVAVLAKLHAYLLQCREQVLPKSEAAQAIQYALNHWEALARYCEDGDLEIDNNRTERSIRAWAVGRGNWTFFGSDRGGRTAAVLRSFVTTCELLKVDPFAWFHDVLARVAMHPITRLDELLPHRWSPAAALH